MEENNKQLVHINGAVTAKPSEEVSIDPRGWFYTLKSNRTIVLCFVLAFTSLTGVYTFFYQKAQFTAEALVHYLPSGNKSLMPSMDFLSGGEKGSTKLEAFVNRFSSRDFSKELAIRLILERPDLFKSVYYRSALRKKIPIIVNEPKRALQNFTSGDWRNLARVMQNRLLLLADAKSNNLTLQSTTLNSAASAELANFAAEYFIKSNHQKILRKVTETESFLKDQTTKLEVELAALESQLVNFQRTNNILEGRDAGSIAYRQYHLDLEHEKKLDRQLHTNQKVMKQTQTQMEMVKSGLGNTKINRSSMYLNQLQHRMNILKYRTALADEQGLGQEERSGIEQELTQVSDVYKRALENRGDQSSNLVSKSSLEYYKELEQTLVKLRQDRDALLAQHEVIMASIRKQKGELGTLPTKIQQLNEIKRNIKVKASLYQDSQKKLQEIQFLKAETPNDLHLLVQAHPPDSPDGVTVVRKFIFAGLVGLLFGLLFSFVKDFLIGTIKDRYDLEKLNIPMLGEITKVNLSPHSSRSFVVELFRTIIDVVSIHREESCYHLLIEEFPDTPEADAFRTIRHKLLNRVRQQNGEAFVVMVTSPHPKSGKSFVASNVSAAMGHSKTKTLLIDLDLRFPTVKNYFPQVRNIPGLETLAKDKTIHGDELIVSINPHLDVLLSDSGTVHPPDLLETPDLEMMFHEWRKKYEIIIIDSPPVLSAIDPAITMKFVDQVIMVVKSQITFINDVESAARKLTEENKKPILGLVNFVDRKVKNYYAAS